MSLWGRLGRWFLKGRISLLALVLRMPVMKKGRLQNPLCSHAALPCTKPTSPQPHPQPPRFLQSFPFGGCSTMIWHCPAPLLRIAALCASSPWFLCLSDASPCCWTATSCSDHPCLSSVSVPYILYTPVSDPWAECHTRGI